MYKIYTCRFLCGHVLSVFLGIHLGMELLGDMVTLWLIYRRIAEYFPKWLQYFVIQLAIFKVFSFFVSPSTLAIFCIFHYGHSAAAAAKSLQSCPTLLDPIDSSPPGSAIPGILQARTLEWTAISFSSALLVDVK